ncbi:MAG: AMP-binding protein, partial [Mycobacterium sp.]|uniref:AMP-binding protein n=1 Tax=Mycobacterium sp. TaxID=1785 RepID=UPI001EB600ED
MPKSPIPALLRERASLQPNRTAFTFMDYEQDWAGIAKTLTWSQLYRRVLNLAHELRLHGSTGDRAVILAPQGLDYITAFLGALQAGFIALPLGGASDERINSVLRDTSPSIVLTTSDVAGTIAEHLVPESGSPSPSVIEVDLLDLDTKPGPAARVESATDTVYLQYTSGSTRTPAGVIVTN